MKEYDKITITAAKECAVDWKEAVCSLIWATHNADIEELAKTYQVAWEPSDSGLDGAGFDV